MNKLLFVLLFFQGFNILAQTAQKEIDEQVWKPFTEAIMNQNVSAFAALHSNDLVRAEINSKKVFGLAEYKKRMEENWPKWKESIQKNKTKYTFELRFTERIANENTAYEIGYFKNETINSNGEKHIGYGKFHVVLRKESGTWKILVDSDSNEGGSITGEMFMAAEPIR